MKKFFSLLLCLVFAALMLVSCSDDVVEPLPDHYPDRTPPEKTATVNLYIIKGDGTTDTAIKTVADQINTYSKNTYNIDLDVIYCTADEYEERALAAINAQNKEEVSTVAEGEEEIAPANIVLVNSEALMEKFMETELIAPFSPLLEDPSYGFASLNVSIPSALLEAARYPDGRIYALPNNHILSQYEYLVIDKSVARDVLFYENATLQSYTSYEDTAQLRADIAAYVGPNGETYNVDECVYVHRDYGDAKATLEAQGNVCTILSMPYVESAEAFSSAFAIVNSGDGFVNVKAGQIVYALNTDPTLRNLLQYGVRGTHYNYDNEVDKNIYYIESDGAVDAAKADKYYMNYLYTGNCFILEYCPEIGWTKERAEMGKKQNNDAFTDVVITEETTQQ